MAVIDRAHRPITVEPRPSRPRFSIHPGLYLVAGFGVLFGLAMAVHYLFSLF